jgi:mRNA interferase MazF
MADELTPKRGEIYLADFDSAVGCEIQKTRPAVILQNDVANQYSSLTILAAISSKFDEKLYPTKVLLNPPQGGLQKRCVVLLNQIRTIDKRRLVKKLGRLDAATMNQIDLAL